MASNLIDDASSSGAETGARWVLILVLIVVAVGLPLVVVKGGDWLDVKRTINPPRPAPNWVTPEPIKADRKSVV